MYIDLLPLRSFRRSEIKTFVRCCARTQKTSPSQLTCSTRDVLSCDTAAEDLSAGASGTLTVRKEAAAEQQ